MDIAWGLGFIMVTWLSLYLSQNINFITVTVGILVSAWGLRLATHVYLRNKDKEEDYRYKKMREDWGKNFYLRSYFQIFMLQGLLMFIITFQIVLGTIFFQNGFNLINIFGILIWFVGFFFEAVGDYQLSQFLKMKAQGETDENIMQSGLWKYTRHPNYFGEVTLWWGIFFILYGYLYWPLGIISPLTITYLILKVSGIPMLEEKYEGNEEFQEYKKRTSAFFPLPPKQINSF